MYTTDPIKKAEELVRGVHDVAGKHTQPVLQRYPLLFALLLTFSLAAILHGFELITDRIQLFDNHPALLIFIGSIVLLFTGTLYKLLDKPDK
jgi:hypothetical protein